MGAQKARRVLDEFLAVATWDGINHIRVGQRRAKVFGWLLCTFLVSLICVYHLSSIIVQLQEGEVIVQPILSDKPIPFPAVTFCNLNPYQRDRLKKSIPRLAALDEVQESISEASKENDQPEFEPKARRKRSVSESVQFIDSDLLSVEGMLISGKKLIVTSTASTTTAATLPPELAKKIEEDKSLLKAALPKAGELGGGDVTVSAAVLQDAMSFIAQDVDPELLEAAGAQLDETFSSCIYDGRQCNLKELKQFLDMQFGNCFIFNWNGTRFLQRAGRQSGLYVRLRSGRSQYLGIVQSVGLRLVIQSPQQFPLPDNEGFNVPTGFQTAVALKLVQLEHQNRPNRPCVTTANQTWFSFEGEYSQEACLQLCRQEALADFCECTDSKKPRLKSRPNIPHCGLEKMSCPEEFASRPEMASEKECSSKACAVRCETDIYERTASQVYWLPTNQSLEECRHTEDFAKCFDQIQSDTVVVRIYLEQATHVIYQEQPKLSWSGVLSQFGGTLSASLGVSFFSLLELVVLALRLFKAYFIDKD